VEGIPSDERSMDAYLDHQFTIEGLMQSDVVTLPTKSTVEDAADVKVTPQGLRRTFESMLAMVGVPASLGVCGVTPI